MTAPKGLGNRGRALWRSVSKALPSDWQFDERELALLTMACRQADDMARLETVIAREGAMVCGSVGQPVLHPALVEARQGRLAVSRLLGQLELPDAEEDPRTEAGKRAKRAAQSRWDQRKRWEERRGAAQA